MIVTAWNNGSYNLNGSGYGLRISARDREMHFDTGWKSVILELPTARGFLEIEANTDKKSFWDPRCGELISKQIGQWLIKQGFARWPKGHPPKFSVLLVAKRRFRVLGL